MEALTSLHNLKFFLALGGIGAGIGFLLAGIYFAVIKPLQRRRQFQQRWRGSNNEKHEISEILKDGRSQILKATIESKNGVVSKLVEKIAGWSKIYNLQNSLTQADVLLTPNTFLSIMGILGCFGYLLGFMKQSFYLSVGLAVLLGYTPYFYLGIKKRRKVARFESQMPEGMELLARSLRAGHTLPSAMKLLSAEIDAPLGTEMGIVYEEQRLGLGQAKALRRMGDRVPSRDLWYFITAVLIQTESGGNLAEIMENIGKIVRARLNLKGKVKALTAEGRFSALILCLLPIVVFVLLFLMNRSYVMPLFQDPLGTKILGAGVVSMLLGVFWMKRMVKIKV
jgi:tight adherence protein B